MKEWLLRRGDSLFDDSCRRIDVMALIMIPFLAMWSLLGHEAVDVVPFINLKDRQMGREVLS